MLFILICIKSIIIARNIQKFNITLINYIEYTKFSNYERDNTFEIINEFDTSISFQIFILLNYL